ncbi:hypothetical protein LN650_25085 [Klebsiella pneumoniae subsp. pneumoniae]|nr:hypothetical protein [Klebsiella pneumoniae subsp. pneumoniae]
MQSQLNTLNKQKEPTPQDKLVQQDLTQTLETLDKIEAYQKRDGTAATAGRARRRRSCARRWRASIT